MMLLGLFYEKAPDQSTSSASAHPPLFRAILSNRKKSGNQSVAALPRNAHGQRNYACTPWGMPT